MQRLDRDALLGLLISHREALDLHAEEEVCGSLAWWQCFLTEVATARDDFLVTTDDGGMPALMLQISSDGRRGAHAVSNYYTALYRPLPLQPDLVRHVSAIVQHRPRLQTLALSPLTESEGFAWRAALTAAGWMACVQPAFGNWYLPCSGLSFENYMAARPAALRNTWRRKSRLFARGTDGARLQLVTSADEVDHAMAAFEVIYRASWKPQESHPGFLRAWARACAQAGWLRLGIAWLGARPIAAQFWYTAGGRAHIFKLAYDEAFSQVSAGTVLSAMLFRHSLEVDGVHEIDYLSGDDPYKQDWMTHRRQRVRVLAFNPRTVTGLVAGLRAQASVWWHRCRSAHAHKPPSLTQDA